MCTFKVMSRPQKVTSNFERSIVGAAAIPRFSRVTWRCLGTGCPHGFPMLRLPEQQHCLSWWGIKIGGGVDLQDTHAPKILT